MHNINSEHDKLKEMIQAWGNAYSLTTAVSLSQYNRVLKIAEELGAEDEKGEVLSSIAHHYILNKKFEAALEYVFEALEIALKYPKTNRVAKHYNWLGYIYKQLGDYSNAIDFYQMEITASLQNKRPQDCFTAYSVLGNIYMDIGDIEMAISFYEKSSQLAEKYPNDEDVIHNLPNLNAAYISLLIKKGRYNEAEELCNKTLTSIRNIDAGDFIEPTLYCNLSLISYYRGDNDSALRYANKMELFTHLGISVKFDIARLKAYSYAALGQILNAEKEYEICIELAKHNKQEHFDAKVEVLENALNFFKNKNSALYTKVQKVLTKLRAEQRIFNQKIALRKEQVISLLNKYAPNELQLGIKYISIQTALAGKIIIDSLRITFCETTTGKEGKNGCRIYMKGQDSYYIGRCSLSALYNTLNSSDFVWINRNVFVNKLHILNKEEYYKTGIVKVAQSNFSFSRRHKQALLKRIQQDNNIIMKHI